MTDFNQIVTIDLKQFGSKYVLWIVCSFTRFIQGIVLKDKKASSIINGLNIAWNWRFGFQSQGFWADNGTEFQNNSMNELASKFGFSIRFGPTYSPWSNGLNERNHFSADVVVKKVMESDKSVSLSDAVSMAAWTHNTNVNVLGYDPMRLVTGKSVTFPGIATGNIATEAAFDSEAIQKIMERHHQVVKEFREAEYETKLEKASNIRNNSFNDIHYKEGDLIFYQDLNNKAWLGPSKVFCHRGRDVWIFANGSLKKSCKLQSTATQNSFTRSTRGL